jgi:hypothetical protein
MKAQRKKIKPEIQLVSWNNDIRPIFPETHQNHISNLLPGSQTMSLLNISNLLPGSQTISPIEHNLQFPMLHHLSHWKTRKNCQKFFYCLQTKNKTVYIKPILSIQRIRNQAYCCIISLISQTKHSPQHRFKLRFSKQHKGFSYDWSITTASQYFVIEKKKTSEHIFLWYPCLFYLYFVKTNPLLLNSSYNGIA